jgi:Flp pilus assembly protein TadD
VSLLNKTLLLEPGFQKAHVLLGKLYLRESRLEDAAKQLREAIRIDPHDRSAIYQLMLLFRRNGNTAEAGALAAKLKDLVVADEKLIR